MYEYLVHIRGTICIIHMCMYMYVCEYIYLSDKKKFIHNLYIFIHTQGWNF